MSRHITLRAALEMVGAVDDQVDLVRFYYEQLQRFRDHRLVHELSAQLLELIVVLQVMGIFNNFSMNGTSMFPELNIEIQPEWYKNCMSRVGVIGESLRNDQVSFSEEDIEEICGIREASRALKAAISIAASRLFMIKGFDHAAALLWAKRGLAFSSTLSVCQYYRFEASLLVAEIYEQIGYIEGALSYLGDVTSQVKAGPLYLKLILHVHSKRIWLRMKSPRAQVHFASLSENNEGTYFRALSALAHIVDKDAPFSDGMSLSFRHFSAIWNEEFNFTVIPKNVQSLLPHAFSPSDRFKRYPAGTVFFAGHKSSVSLKLESAAFDLLQHLPQSYCGFDTIRNLRRRAALDMLLAGYDALDAFILACASCGTSLECFSALQHLDGQLCDALRSGNFKEIKSMIENQSNVLKLALYEKQTKILLLGRCSKKSCVLMGIKCSSAFEELIESWARTLGRNKELLKTTVDSERLSDWSHERKREWWNEREIIDGDISHLLESLEAFLGPWKCVLSSVTHTFLGSEIISVLSQCVDNSQNHEYKLSFMKEWTSIVLNNLRSDCLSRADAIEALGKVFAAVSNLSQGDLRLAIFRILKNSANQSDSDEELLVESLSKLRVTELRAKLKDKSECTVGRKDELVNRLASVLLGEKATIDANNTMVPSNIKPLVEIESSALILCEFLQILPFEGMPYLSSSSMTRIPGLYIFLRLQSNHTLPSQLISTFKNCWYLVDPENSLPNTQQTILPFLQPYTEMWHWDGYVATAPTEQEFR